MNHIAPQILFFLEAIIFVSVVALHLTKKNSSAIILYMIQSAAIAFLLILSSLEESSNLLLIAIFSTILVKIIIAPYFFFKLIKRHQIKFLVSNYLNTPITLLIISALVAITQTDFLKPLIELSPSGQNFLTISIAIILISIFLIINRKGALSQMLGILSLENGIVSFALFSGLEQNPGLQLGITFNILIWVIIASVFASMIYKQFGSLDVSAMKKLTE